MTHTERAEKLADEHTAFGLVNHSLRIAMAQAFQDVENEALDKCAEVADDNFYGKDAATSIRGMKEPK